MSAKYQDETLNMFGKSLDLSPLRRTQRTRIASVALVGLLLAACQAAPPLRSDKYLFDTGLIVAPAVGGQPCDAPCWKGIIPGISTFVDGVSKIKADAAFKDVQERAQDATTPASATWSAAAGEQCCQMVANLQTGLVESILIRVASNAMTAQQVIDKHGEPPYVQTGDYSETESVVQLIYPQQGFITWVVPGAADSTFEPTDPITAVIYIDPKLLDDLIRTATLGKWSGFGVSYRAIQSATPVITAVPTATATPG